MKSGEFRKGKMVGLKCDCGNEAYMNARGMRIDSKTDITFICECGKVFSMEKGGEIKGE